MRRDAEIPVALVLLFLGCLIAANGIGAMEETGTGEVPLAVGLWLVVASSSWLVARGWNNRAGDGD